MRTPPDARLCVMLAYNEGMSHAEISDSTSIPLGTVKSHIARGAARLPNSCRPMGVLMVHESDADHTRLFAEAREPLRDDEFVRTLMLQIERRRWAHWWRRLLGLAVIAVLVSMNLRWILGTTATVVRAVGDYSPAYSTWMISPAGWAVSVGLGAWVVLRYRPSRR